MKFQSVAVFAALLLFSVESRAQTTAFTYQGQLSSNNVPANGLYDLRFQLFDVSSNVVGSPLTNAPTGVTNGQFTVMLNFGAAIFDGSDHWLQIAVRNYSDTNDYTPLSPLQPITSVPYAIRSINAAIAANATNAINLIAPLKGTNITGIISVSNLPPNIAFVDSNQTFIGANTFSGVMTANNSGNTFSGTFTGEGAGLKNLAATNLTGTLPDARLSANVALQSNTVVNFAGSVGASNFVGAGHGLTNVPGAFFWVVPTNGFIYPNVGYICTDDFTPVTMILPTTNSASIGDTYKIVGVGAAGWIIAQTNGETIFAGNLSSSVGLSWKTNGVSADWSAIACSSDGKKWIAVVGDTAGNTGQIYTNDNSGVGTWTPRDSARQWIAVASSSDGTKAIAANYASGGSGSPGVYTSTDSGGTWTRQLNVSSCTSVAASADGSKMVAVVNGGAIYTNSGTTFKAATNTTLLWKSVASSGDGTKLVAVEGNGSIVTSSNSGASWQLRTNVGSGAGLNTVACSADGSRLIAGTSTGTIYLSTDSGLTWNAENPAAISGQLTDLASSADGSRLFATCGNSSAANIAASFDSGLTWTTLSAAPAAKWAAIASSADGSLLGATIYGGKIYISSQSSTTAGATGYLSGAQHSAIELIYTGDGNFLPLNHEGTIRAY